MIPQRELPPNPLKEALAENRQTYGSWITMGHPLIAEVMAGAGFDWLTIDLEHSTIDWSQMLTLIMAIGGCGVVPLVRVAENSPLQIKKAMDAGAYGVIVPCVNDAAQAAAAVRAVKYPPEGSRGVGLYRAQKHGRCFAAYCRWLTEQSVVIVQIEHIEAVGNIDAILTTPGVDAFMVGPYDLSGSLGRPGQFDHPEVVAAMQAIMAAARRHKVTAGFHAVAANPDEARRRIDEGYRFLAFSLDAIFLGDTASDGLAKLKGA